jgi:hypothetical protein
MSSQSVEVPGLYGWLDLLRIFADTHASSALLQLAGSKSDLESLRAIARQLLEDYLDDGNRYDWSDDNEEVIRIEHALAKAFNSEEIALMRSSAAVFGDEGGARAATAWRRLLQGMSSKTDAVQSAEARLGDRHLDEIVDEFLKHSTAAEQSGEGDSWDEWFKLEHPESDPVMLLNALRRGNATRHLQQQLRSLSETDRRVLRSRVGNIAEAYGLPSDVVRQLEHDISAHGSPSE